MQEKEKAEEASGVISMGNSVRSDQMQTYTKISSWEKAAE